MIILSNRREKEERRREEHIERRRTTPPTRLTEHSTRRTTVINKDKTEQTHQIIPPKTIDDSHVKLMNLRSSTQQIRTSTRSILNRIQSLDREIVNTQSRITDIRSKNYLYMKEIENEYESILEKWKPSKQVFEAEANSKIQLLMQKVNAFENQLDRSPSSHSIENLEYQAKNLESHLNQINYLLNAQLSGFQSDEKKLSEKISIAESTLENLSSSSITWKYDENPVISVKAHALDSDVHGVLTLTNMRVLFEEEREVVLKRTFFVATEKKKVREVKIDEPVGAIQQINKGRVGLLKGSGVFVTFKPSFKQSELRFDLKNKDVENLTYFFNVILTGQLEHKEGTEETGKKQLIRCPYCSAPYTKEIYRGQTTIKCSYCGTAFRL